MLQQLINWFTNKKPHNNVDINTLRPISTSIDYIDYSSFTPPEITNINGDKTLLILDDIVYSKELHSIDFNKISAAHNIDVHSDFKIVSCLGADAGFAAYKYVAIDNNIIDYALLDLTIGHSIRLSDGSYVMYDGVDIATEIYKRNPDAVITFITAHTINMHVASIAKYANKLKKNTGMILSEHYIPKLSDTRSEAIYRMLYGDTQ